ncbi:MAG: hypothetical protein CVV27_18595 [Candidatus Melainabacteria bacterium HGW-Melainabacteria-1]|nr:MAG: hypothetical protein CVV27_18595 [Candidatus Melainabacteria bacterium HGW-Melainabacteria-1]
MVSVLTTNGMPQTLPLQGVMGALDIAGDGRNGDVYVLEQAEIKRFGMSGQLLGRTPHGATQPVSIAVDEMGNVYVSDYGTSSSDSKILKFSPPGGMPGAMPNQMGYPQTGYAGAYPQTGAGYGTGYDTGYGAGYGTTPAYGSTPAYGNPYPQTGAGYATTPSYGNPYPSTGTGTGYGAYNTGGQSNGRQY